MYEIILLVLTAAAPSFKIPVLVAVEQLSAVMVPAGGFVVDVTVPTSEISSNLKVPPVLLHPKIRKVVVEGPVIVKSVKSKFVAAIEVGGEKF